MSNNTKSITTMEVYYIQLTTLLSLLCGNFLFGFAPLLILKITSWLFCSEAHFVHTRNRITTVFLVFGGGVFMATSLLVLMPQTRKHYEAFEGSHHSSEESTSHEEAFPNPEFIVLCGFFATFFLEEFLHYILYHFHSRKTNNNLRVRFCSCAKRHTECSRTFKADVPDQTLYGLEKKNSALGLEYSEFTRPSEEATNMTTNLLMPQSALPNYGAVGVALDDERTNTPVNVLTPPPLITDNVVRQTKNRHTSGTQKTSNMFLLAIVCCHALLQGIHIGFITGGLLSGSSWRQLLILCLQQTLLTFVIGSVGLSISKLSTSFFFVVAMSAMSPAGIGIAMLLFGVVYNELALCVVKALLCGSLLYFTFYDLLGRPSLKEAPHFSNFVGFSLGAAAVALLLYASEIVGS